VSGAKKKPTAKRTAPRMEFEHKPKTKTSDMVELASFVRRQRHANPEAALIVAHLLALKVMEVWAVFESWADQLNAPSEHLGLVPEVRDVMRAVERAGVNWTCAACESAKREAVATARGEGAK